MMDDIGKRLIAPWQRGALFMGFVARRFLTDQCTWRAAGLTYTTLLALVPLLAISFAIFSAFPAFETLQGRVQSYVFQNFVPQVGDTVLTHLEGFTRQTGKLTAVGIGFLIFTSVMLLLTINRTFDTIWRVHEPRVLLSRLLVYWAVLTLAPLCVGASVSISGYLFTVAQSAGVERYTGPLAELTRFLPVLFQFAGFTVLYLVMPNFPVRWRDALIGGFSAALLFELLKKGFGLYVTSFPTYETIYGALATFPIFLVWMYIAWVVVLFGAELTAAMPEWRAGRRAPGPVGAERPAQGLIAALGILHALLVSSRRGGGLPLSALIRSVSVSPDQIATTIRTLHANRYIARGEHGDWLVARDLSSTTLADLCSTLGLSPEAPRGVAGAGEAWKRRYGEIAAAIAEANERTMAIDLKTLLATEGDAEAEIAHLLDEEPEHGPAVSRRARLLAWITLGWLGSS